MSNIWPLKACGTSPVLHPTLESASMINEKSSAVFFTKNLPFRGSYLIAGYPRIDPLSYHEQLELSTPRSCLGVRIAKDTPLRGVFPVQNVTGISMCLACSGSPEGLSFSRMSVPVAVAGGSNSRVAVNGTKSVVIQSVCAIA